MMHSIDHPVEFEQLVQDYIHDTHYTSTAQATCNVIYAIINAGMVMLPLCAYCGGVGVFAVCIFLACVISGYSSVMLVKMAHDQDVRRYEDLAELAFGGSGFYIVSFLQIALSLLIMIITINVFCDIMQNFMGKMLEGNGHHNIWGYLSKRYVIIITGALLVLPRCFSSSMSRLRVSSILSIFALVLAVASIIFVYSAESDPYKSVNPWRVTPKWWLIPGIALFSVSYHQKAFLVYNCLRKRTPARWARAVVRGHLVVAIAYIVFGSLGFLYLLRVGSDVNPDYFNSYPEGFSKYMKIAFDISRIAMAFSLLCTMPVDFLVAMSTLKRVGARYLQFKRTKQSTKTASRQSNVHSYLTVKSDDEETDSQLEETDLSRIRARDEFSNFSPVAPEGYSKREWRDIVQRDWTSKSNYTMTPSCNQLEVGGGEIGSNGERLDSLIARDSDLSESTRTSMATTVRHVAWTPEARLRGSGGAQRAFDATGRENTVSASDTSLLADYHNANDAVPGFDLSNQLQHEELWEPGRSSSVGLIEPNRIDTPQSLVKNVLPVVLVWAVVVVASIFVRDWPVCIATAGAVLTSLLVLLMPSMLYFRIGVVSDFQAIPLFGVIIPNRLFMSLQQLLGILFLFGNIVKLVMVAFHEENFDTLYMT